MIIEGTNGWTTRVTDPDPTIFQIDDDRFLSADGLRMIERRPWFDDDAIYTLHVWAADHWTYAMVTQSAPIAFTFLATGVS